MSYPASDLKRQTRITAAKLALKQADQMILRFPNGTATPVIRELKLVINDLISELHYFESTRLATTTTAGEPK